jgi:hypothetical protein
MQIANSTVFGSVARLRLTVVSNLQFAFCNLHFAMESNDENDRRHHPAGKT